EEPETVRAIRQRALYPYLSPVSSAVSSTRWAVVAGLKPHVPKLSPVEDGRAEGRSSPSELQAGHANRTTIVRRRARRAGHPRMWHNRRTEARAAEGRYSHRPQPRGKARASRPAGSSRTSRPPRYGGPSSVRDAIGPPACTRPCGKPAHARDRSA